MLKWGKWPTVFARASFSRSNSFVSLKINNCKRSPSLSNREIADGASGGPCRPCRGANCIVSEVGELGARRVLVPCCFAGWRTRWIRFL